eukprot:16041408-Heterocapsa_arctica.AAC.2
MTRPAGSTAPATSSCSAFCARNTAQLHPIGRTAMPRPRNSLPEACRLLQLADELVEGDVGQAEPLGNPAAEAQPVVPVGNVARCHGQLRSRRDLERGHGARTSKRYRRWPLPQLVRLALVEDEPEHNAVLLRARDRVEDLLHHGEEAHRAPHLLHADDHVGLSHADGQSDHLGAQRGVDVGLVFWEDVAGQLLELARGVEHLLLEGVEIELRLLGDFSDGNDQSPSGRHSNVRHRRRPDVPALREA